MSEKNGLIQSIISQLSNLTIKQLQRIRDLIVQYRLDGTFWRNPKSDIINQGVLDQMADALREHHSISFEPFTKDKLEHLLERVLPQNGIPAKKATAGKPGEDIFIKGVPISVKTEAEASIKKDYIHISKFRELGKGEWTDKPEQLVGLCEQFVNHMKNYERILTLRCLRTEADKWNYELVEIPKALLLEAKDGQFEMKLESRQLIKPGYCYVYEKKPGLLGEEKGKLKFCLYFDGGGERKLQIKSLDKSLCMVHATWKFAKLKKAAE